MGLIPAKANENLIVISLCITATDTYNTRTTRPRRCWNYILALV